jgi:hypothetical protein
MHDDDETREERRAREGRERWDAKSHAVCAKLFDADRPTTNGHVYPKHVLEKMAADMRERIAKGEVLGGFLDLEERADYTALRDASHKITDVRVEGNTHVAQMEILPTPQGKILQELVERGAVFFTSCVEAALDKYGVVMDGGSLYTVSAACGQNPNYSMGCKGRQEETDA